MGDAHGRGEADDLSAQPAFAEEESEVARRLEHLGAFRSGGLFGFAVLDHFDAEHEAFAADITDHFVLFLQLVQSGEDVFAHLAGIFLQVFPLDDLEHGLAHGTDHGVAAEGVEVDFAEEGLRDFVGGDDGGQGATVADAFGHCDDVGDDTLRFEAPEMRAGSSEAGLNFVRDADPASGADVSVNVLEVSRREFDESADALDGLRDEAGNLARRGVFDEFFDVIGVFRARVGIVVSESSAVRIGRERMVEAEAVRHVVFPRAVRGDAHGRLVAAVVGVAQGDDVVVAGVSTRHHQGQIVGFGAGIHEVAGFEVARHFRGQLRGVFGHVRVKIDGGGMLILFALPVAGRDDVRVAMSDADCDDAAESVEVALPFLVPHVLHPALHDHERFFVVEENAGVHELLAQGKHFVGRWSGIRSRLVIARGERGFLHRFGKRGRIKL